MANTTLGVITESANEEAYVWLTKADDEIATSFTIDWGDGSTVESYQASATDSPTEYTHTYTDAGSYTIEIEVTAGKLRFFKEYGDYDPNVVDSNVHSVSTGDGLAVIGAYAFWNWGYETSVSITFGSDLELIDDCAFQMASGISTIDIPPNVELGELAFDSVTNYDIEEQEQSSIESITIGSGCVMGANVFTWAKVSSVTFYSGVTAIGDRAFLNVEGLTEIAIPSTVTSIDEMAFNGIETLETVTIRATTPPTLINGYPFGDCTNLTTIYVPTESLSAYQSASGWSTASSLFVGTDVGPDPTPPSPEPPGPEPGPEPEPVVITGKEYLNDAGVMTLIGFIQYALAAKQDISQVSEMAEASEELLGKVFQFIGTTTANYIHGFFYECVSDGQETPTYSWQSLSTMSQIEIQVFTMPTASDDYLGKILQFVGTTDSTYTNGFFYKCVSDGQSTPTYSWEVVNVNPVATTTTAGLMSAADKAKLDAISYATTADIDAMFE